jgi:hypothetical protein
LPVIDEQGRLFGKINVIDGIAILFALLLIPIAYGAMLLFRVPAPTVTAVEPAQMLEHQPGILTITGADFRPFLRASFGGVFSPGFLVQTPSKAEVKVPDLPAGTYDLILYDEGQELLRKPGALTVVAPPAAAGIPLQVLGRFVDLTPEDARLIAAGVKFGQTPLVAETLAAQPAEPSMQRVRVAPTATIETPVAGKMQVTAILRVFCLVSAPDCIAAGKPVAQDAVLSLPVSDAFAKQRKTVGVPQLNFLVDEARSGDAPVTFPSVRKGMATVHVRFVVRPQVLEWVKAGDTDLGSLSPTGSAALTAIGADRQTMSARTGIDASIGRPYEVEQTLTGFEATVRVPVELTRSGWQYKAKPVKVGALFTFETMAYSMDGWILSVTIG